MRTGIGYDTHRLKPTKEATFIPLGGIHIPCLYEIEAFSDGDVVLHALTDALLGSLALGDIGSWFPDTEIENRKRDSKEFVKLAQEKVCSMGWNIGNVDGIIHLESPKIGPYRDSIRQNLAMLLGIELDSVSIKAKTEEGLGPIGERLAIGCTCIVTLSRTW